MSPPPSKSPSAPDKDGTAQKPILVTDSPTAGEAKKTLRQMRLPFKPLQKGNQPKHPDGSPLAATSTVTSQQVKRKLSEESAAKNITPSKKEKKDDPGAAATAKEECNEKTTSRYNRIRKKYHLIFKYQPILNIFSRRIAPTRVNKEDEDLKKTPKRGNPNRDDKEEEEGSVSPAKRVHKRIVPTPVKKDEDGGSSNDSFQVWTF